MPARIDLCHLNGATFHYYFDLIYNLTLTIQPVNERPFMDVDGLEPGRGGLMTVPAESVHYGRTVHCHEGGCDYWIDTVFESGAMMR
jgi:hypothetical protein